MYLRVSAIGSLAATGFSSLMHSTDEPILILGATGKTGRRVAERLHARGRPVRLGSREATPPFDWEDRSTWLPALRGTSAAYVSFYPDLAVPGAPEAIAAFTELALAQGTRRLVLLSGRGEPEAQRAERALQDSGAEWTIVRCSWFMQNFSESYLLDPIRAGDVVLPATDTAEPFVDADDIADVAVAALTEDGHAGKLYELTGPRLLSFDDAIGEIAQASGRPVSLRRVSLDDYTGHMRSEGVPAGAVALIGYLFEEVLDGRNAHVVDGVERALGRPPRDFAEFTRKVAASGAWSAA
jgi:uncharacterized protein YbjT (DUF2867 family)